MPPFVLFLMNIAVMAILGLLTWFMNWSGPGFALGCLCGFFSLMTYMRWKLGYWP